jgi:hypothetical protein
MTALTAARPGPSKAPKIAKIEGQVRDLRKMVQAGTYCLDVVVQAALVTRRRRRPRSGSSPTTSTTAR